ncbi:DUF7285 family protein [Halomicrococcus sp. SG-WS-1]|uniref:DUF7285 family protein n=1 Tax=Halomicrococcus sp. SG-WS-1 TaxID=3439057 RepID=UPI003F78FDDE
MRRWSPDRGQTEPLVALVAVFAVAVGLATYAGTLSSALPEAERNHARDVLPEVEAAATTNGVVDPATLRSALAAGPDGPSLAVTLSTAGERWHAGPEAPPDAETASTTVSVRVAPGAVRPGRLQVAVWR